MSVLLPNKFNAWSLLHYGYSNTNIFVKGKGLGTCYSAAYMSRLKQQRFTISEVAADWR